MQLTANVDVVLDIQWNENTLKPLHLFCYYPSNPYIIGGTLEQQIEQLNATGPHRWPNIAKTFPDGRYYVVNVHKALRGKKEATEFQTRNDIGGADYNVTHSISVGRSIVY